MAQKFAMRDEDKLISGIILLIKQAFVSNTFLELLTKRKYSKYTHPVDQAGVTKIIYENEVEKIWEYCTKKIEFIDSALAESSKNVEKFGNQSNWLKHPNFRKAFFMVNLVYRVLISAYIFCLERVRT